MTSAVPPAPPTGSAIVFGASGAIGAAIARRLVASGRYVSVHAGGRSGQGLPPGTVPLSFDLGDEASIQAALAALTHPPERVIVATGVLHDASAGVAPEKSLRALKADALAHVFAVNVIGPALIAKHSLPLLPRDRRAEFFALSARVGSITDNRLGGWHAYRASKAALNMLIRTCAIDLARTHPLAVAATLHPGTVASAMSAPFQRNVAPEKLFSPEQSADYLLEVMEKLTPEDSGGFFAWDGARVAF